MSQDPRISQPFVGVELPIRCIFGMQEDPFRVFEAVKRYTIRRRTRILEIPGTAKMGFRLSCSGDDVQAPPADLLRLGSRLTYRSMARHTRLVQPDETTVRLERDAVPGRVFAQTLSGARIAVTVDGDEVTLPARSEAVTLRYRLLHEVIVTAGLTPTQAEATGTGSGWSCEIEEEYGQ